MNSVLEIMKATTHVRFVCLYDRKLWYDCQRGAEEETVFKFTIPLHDTDGGTFPAFDDKPMLYMRWIRKQFEANKAEQEMIAKAKEEWDAEQAKEKPETD